MAWLVDRIARARAAIVHLHTFGSQILGTRAALRTGTRIVRTEHSTRDHDDPWCRPFTRWSLRRADAVVAVSAHLREVALARAPWLARRLAVVHNGVDTARFAPAAAPRAPAFTFAVVGRLDRRKGVDRGTAA